MTTFEILLQQIGLFVIYILAGVILVRTKVLNRETLEPISKFVIKMALPVMIFINIIDGVNKEILTGSWSILLIAAGFYAVMFLVSFGMTKFFHLSENCAGICQAMMLFGNIGFMAVPVISSVFPGNGILYVSVFMVFDQLMLWTLGVKLTTPPGSGGFELKKLINPATVAILIGMLLMLTGVRIPALLDTGLQKIGATASPLAMIYIGGIFAELPLKKYLKEFSLYGIVLVRMLLAPLLMFFVLGLFSGQCGDTTCNGTDYRNADDDCGCDDGERVRNGWRICTRGRFYHDALRNRNFAVHLLAAAIYDIRTDYKKDTNFFRVFLRECRCPFL